MKLIMTLVASMISVLCVATYSSSAFAQSRRYYFEASVLEADYFSYSFDTKTTYPKAPKANQDLSSSEKSLHLLTPKFTLGNITSTRLVEIQYSLGPDEDTTTKRLTTGYWGMRFFDLYVGPMMKLDYSISKSENDYSVITTGTDESNESGKATRQFAIGPAVVIRNDRTWGMYEFLFSAEYNLLSVETDSSDSRLEGLLFRIGGKYGYQLAPELQLTGGASLAYALFTNFQLNSEGGIENKGDGTGLKLKWDMVGLRYLF